MANYFDKNRTPDTPGQSPARESDDKKMIASRQKLPPTDPGAADTGSMPIDPAMQDASGAPAAAPGQAPPATQPLDPTVINRVGDMMANPALMNSPMYQQIADNRNKLIALKMQPTYVNKKGETVQGVQDKNGRLQSGLKAFLGNLAQPGQVRDWSDLLAKVSGSISAGVTGSIVPEWDENNDRLREIQRLEDETRNMMGMAEWDSKMQTQQSTRANQAARTNIANGQLQERVARNQWVQTKDEHKAALEPIFKRGYYYEGDNPEEDAKLAKLNVVLPDFDNSRKAIVDNGQRKAWNPQTRSYEAMQGSEVDPDDVPMTFSVDGKEITASRRQFVGYAGAKERQASQQTFQADENKKNREVQWAKIKQAATQFKAKTASDLVVKRLAIQKSVENMDISQEEGDELLQILNTNNPDFK